MAGTSFRLLDRARPDAAAALAADLFLRPRRFRRPAREGLVLAEARAFPLRTAWGDLATWIWGEPPYVALAHGWEGRASQLGSFVAPLRRRGFGVLAVDAPGHGASPGSRATLVAMADALEAAADRFGPLAGVVAHSAGAIATTRALHRGLPARRVAFVAPGADLPTYAAQFTATFRLEPGFTDRLRRAVEARVGLPWEELDPRRLAPEIGVPLVVVHDRTDREAPLSAAKELAAAWPGADLLVTEGLGHRRILRDETVVDRVTSFVATDARRARPASSTSWPDLRLAAVAG